MNAVSHKSMATRNRVNAVCPHCSSAAQIRSSSALTDLHRNFYFFCTNHDCGHTWLATLSFSHTISPSATPREGLNLPTGPRSGRKRDAAPSTHGTGTDPPPPDLATSAAA